MANKLILENTEFDFRERQKLSKYLPIMTRDEMEVKKPTHTTEFSTEENDFDTFFIAMPNGEALVAASESGKSPSNKNFDQHFNTNESLLAIYRGMAAHPIIDACVTETCNEALIFNSNPNSDPIKVVFSREKLKRKFNISEKTSKKFISELENHFQDFLYVFEMKRKGYERFRNWYVDGQAHFEIVYHKNKKGIQDIRYLSPFNVIKIKVKVKDEGHTEERPKFRTEFYYVYDGSREKEALKKYKAGKYTDNDFAGLDFSDYIQEPELKNSQVRLIPEKFVVTLESGLKDPSGFPRSHLHYARKDLNQLVLLQDAIVVYRVSRAPERRVFYVDVGSIAPSKIKQMLQSIAKQFKQKQIFDLVTGEVLDHRRHLATTEDFFIPRYSNGQTTQIETLKNAESMNNIPEVEYFQKNVYRALKVPITRFMDSQAVVSLGQDQTLTRDELTFNKFIQRIRQKWNELLLELFKRYLISLNVIKDHNEWIKLDQCMSIVYEGENYYAKTHELDMLSKKLDVFQRVIMDVEAGRFSLTWAYQTILGFTQDEIEDIQTQSVEELKRKLQLKMQTYEMERELWDLEKISMGEDPYTDDEENNEPSKSDQPKEIDEPEIENGEE